MMDMGGPSPVWVDATSGPVVLGCIRRQAEQAVRNKAWAVFLRPTYPGPLPGVPELTSLNDRLWWGHGSQTNSSLSWFGHGVDHSQLKFVVGAHLGGTWSAIDCAFPCGWGWNTRWGISCAHSGVRIYLPTCSPKALPPHVGLGLLWICCSCSVTVTKYLWVGGMESREERVQFGLQHEGGVGNQGSISTKQLVMLCPLSRSRDAY